MAARKKFSIVISAIDKATAPLKKTQRKIAALGKSMARTGRSLSMGLSLPIIAFGGFTIKAAADFEASMNRVRGITKATADDFKLLREQAMLLGRTTQFSASQAASAQENLARAGFTTVEVMSALPGVLQLAASSGVELAEAAKLGAGMVRGFGFEAKDLTRINDALVTANLSTNTTLESIVDTMKEVAPLAQSMGLDFGEVTAAAGLMGDALLEGGRGGVAIKTIFSQLLTATPQAERVLARLKIPRKNILDDKGNVTSLIAVIQELEKAGATTTDIFTIFGRRGAVAVSALVNRGSAELVKLTEKINGDDSVGEAARQAEIRMEGAAGAMLKFKSAAEGLQIAIGDAASLVESLTEFTQGMAESNPVGLKLGVAIAGLVAIVGPLMILIGLAATAFAAFTAPIWITIGAVIALIAAAGLLIAYWKPVNEFFADLGNTIGGTINEIVLMFERWFGVLTTGFAAVRSAIPDFLLSALGVVGFQPLQLSGAGGDGGTLPPARSEVGGQIGLKIESDVPVSVTSLDSTGDLEIEVDSGPGMAGL